MIDLAKTATQTLLISFEGGAIWPNAKDLSTTANQPHDLVREEDVLDFRVSKPACCCAVEESVKQCEEVDFWYYKKYCGARCVACLPGTGTVVLPGRTGMYKK